MKARTFSIFLFSLFLMLSAVAQNADTDSKTKAVSPESNVGQILYVSLNGSDKEGSGSADAPFATVAHAITRINSKQEATIRLLPGIYREQVTLHPAKGENIPALIIEGSENGEVIFEGGEAVTKWTALPAPADGVFRIMNATSQTVRTNEGEYYEVWNAKERIRFRKQADLAGVMAYPASVAVENEAHLLIHTNDGKEPEHLWRSNLVFAIAIERDHVTLRNLTFRNYTGGGSAHAVAIGKKTHYATIEQCRFENITCAIQNDGAHTRVANTQMWEVSRGVETRGDEVTVEDCIIEAATGNFTFSDNNQHRRNGIRIYHPSRGGIVRRNMTAGFWAGLYIKTASAMENALPILVEHNTFMDGINFGPQKQPKTTLRYNIIGPIKAEHSSIRRLLGMDAVFEYNYFFDSEFLQTASLEPSTNFTGPAPFANLVEGDLNITDPQITKFKIGASVLKHQWIPAVQRMLVRETPVKAVSPLSILSALEKTVSRQGALLLTTLSAPADEVFVKFRPKGEKEWKQVPGQINRLVEPAILSTPAPVEPAEVSSVTSYLFDLTSGQLVPEKTYEAMLVARQKKGKSVESDIIAFQTTGDPKVIYVDSQVSASDADGTAEHPWSQLQQALDRALPGDTVELAEGVYTKPALLLHGGTSDYPIIIKGQSKKTTIMDGGKEFSILLKIENAPHVSVADLTFRWFGDSGLMASDCLGLQVERCHFQNSLVRRGANGRAGLYLLNSPQSKISFNTFTTAENGARLENSQEFVFQNNTAFANLYAGLQVLNSSRDSVLTHNAFTFTGNTSMDVLERDRSAWDSITCNFNNYGNRLNNGNSPERPENDFRPLPHYGKISGKAIIRCWIALPESAGEVASQSFYSMKAWREFSGQDKDSIFADPNYIDPLNNDFHIQPASPHFLANGKLIGAEGHSLSTSSAAQP